jgi:uncharacterized protein (TIGR02145 family)
MEIVNVKNAPMKNKATYLIISLFLACASLQMQAQRNNDKGDQKEQDKDTKSKKKKTEDPTLREKSNESVYEKELSALLLTEEAKKQARKQHSFFERLFSSDDEMLKQERIDSLNKILGANQRQMESLKQQLADEKKSNQRGKDQLAQELKREEEAKANQGKTVQIGETRWAKENLNVEVLTNGDSIKEIDIDDNAGWVQAYKSGQPAFVILNVDGEEAKAYNYWAIVSGKLAPVNWRIPSLEDAEELRSQLERKYGKGAGAEHLRKESAFWGKVKGKKVCYDTFDLGFLPFGYYSSRGWISDESILRLALESLSGMVYLTGDSNEVRVQEIESESRKSSLGWVVRCVLDTK